MYLLEIRYSSLIHCYYAKNVHKANQKYKTIQILYICCLVGLGFKNNSLLNLYFPLNIQLKFM